MNKTPTRTAPQTSKEPEETKSIPQSISFPPALLKSAKTQAEKSKESLSRYMCSLIERDVAGELWMGSATDPKDEKVIEEISKKWCPGHTAKFVETLKGSKQPKVFSQVMAAFAEFTAIHETLNNIPPPDFKTIEQSGELTIMPKSEVNRLRRELKRCAKTLESITPDETLSSIPFGGSSRLHAPVLGMSSLERKLRDAICMVRFIDSLAWLKDSNEAKAWLEDVTRHEIEWAGNGQRRATKSLRRGNKGN